MVFYDTVNTFQLPDLSYLFVDIFCRNNQLICISPIKIKPFIYSLTISVNGRLLTDYKKILHSHAFYTIVYPIYNVHTDTQVTVDVVFNNIRKKFILHHRICRPSMGIIHSTLFKDDSFLLNNFIHYHEKQGVEHFFMYYNKKDALEYPSKPNVTVIHWDFPYPNNYAQKAHLVHALYKYGKPMSQYILFNDLDEFTYIPNLTLKQLIIDKPGYSAYMFLNVWCDTIEEPDNIEEYRKTLITNDLPKTFYRDTYIWPFGKRSKNLICTKDIDQIFSVHEVASTNIYSTSDNVSLHFFRWVPPFSDHGNRTRAEVNFTKYTEFSLPA